MIVLTNVPPIVDKARFSLETRRWSHLRRQPLAGGSPWPAKLAPGWCRSARHRSNTCNSAVGLGTQARENSDRKSGVIAGSKSNDGFVSRTVTNIFSHVKERWLTALPLLTDILSGHFHAKNKKSMLSRSHDGSNLLIDRQPISLSTPTSVSAPTYV